MSEIYQDVIDQLKEYLHADLTTVKVDEETFLFNDVCMAQHYTALVDLKAEQRPQEIIDDLVDNAMEIDFRVDSHFVASISAKRTIGHLLELDIIMAEAY